MDPMDIAKKQVLKDLIKEMQARMIATGDAPETSEEMPEDVEESGEEMEAECPVCEDEEESEPSVKPKGKGMTITLAAIKKGSKPAGKMPEFLESALMGQGSKFKRKG